MALHDDEMNIRRQRREEMKQKRLKEQRRLKIALICAAVLLVGCGVGIFFLSRNGSPLIQSGEEAPATQATTVPTQPTDTTPNYMQNQTTTIHIRAAGDLNITDAVVDSGLTATGYDYTRALQDVATELAVGDLTVLNLEGNICGEPYGTARTSAPKELLDALRCAGVDLVQSANSATINNGIIGLSSTLKAIRAAGLEPLGAYANTAEFNRSKGFTMCEVNGIRVAFVAFTKGVGGMGLPSGNEKAVNLLYADYDSEYDEVDRDGIRKLLRTVKAEKPDITIAMLHWGSEYNDAISDTQESIVSLMQKEGVNVIIGTHPHLVQRIDFNPAAGTLTAFSLGDFYGDGTAGGSNYSIILDVEITKDNLAGTTRVTGYDYTPIYTLRDTQCDGRYRVVRINEAMNAYENNFVDKVTKDCYEDMAYSLTRIEERIAGNASGKKTESN